MLDPSDIVPMGNMQYFSTENTGYTRMELVIRVIWGP